MNTGTAPPIHVVGGGLAELVCSNSFRSDDPDSRAIGMVHQKTPRCDR